jgi:hypothetical protein
MGLNEAGSTDEGLFGLEALSATFWGWVKEVGWRVPCPTWVETGSWRRYSTRGPWKRGVWFCGGCGGTRHN